MYRQTGSPVPACPTGGGAAGRGGQAGTTSVCLAFWFSPVNCHTVKLPFRGCRGTPPVSGHERPTASRDASTDRPGPEGPQRRLHALETRLETLEVGLREQANAIDALRRDLQAQLEWRDQLTMAVAEGIENVQRAERRVRATVARARKELREHGMESAGLEAEWSELRERDGDGGEGEGVPPVQEHVARDPSAPLELGDAYPGAWTQADLELLSEG